ncbi:hypothetical protein BUL40_06200 [Croceivirga radicis]|uniref:Uncharacterized protein n=1 Tax=Croceivirga radicis TaxID=1929488 RepID=A0A1V6LTH6_9FLAO|nr:hypothetical protein BUL40_06200 [Croceivirga radicis]
MYPVRKEIHDAIIGKHTGGREIVTKYPELKGFLTSLNFMNRIGLELLKQVDKNVEGFSDLVSNPILPSVFLNFISLYKIGYQSFKLEKIVLDDQGMDLYPLTSISMYDGVEMNGEEYFSTIDHIFPHQKILEEVKKYQSKEENWNTKGFIQIGLMLHGDVLLLGVEDENKDEIWRYGQGLLNQVHSKLEDNIFDFFMRAKEVLLEDDIEDWGINSSRIYKLLKEDFWRVKE